MPRIKPSYLRVKFIDLDPHLNEIFLAFSYNKVVDLIIKPGPRIYICHSTL